MRKRERERERRRRERERMRRKKQKDAAAFFFSGLFSCCLVEFAGLPTRPLGCCRAPQPIVLVSVVSVLQYQMRGNDRKDATEAARLANGIVPPKQRHKAARKKKKRHVAKRGLFFLLSFSPLVRVRASTPPQTAFVMQCGDLGVEMGDLTRAREALFGAAFFSFFSFVSFPLTLRLRSRCCAPPVPPILLSVFLIRSRPRAHSHSSPTRINHSPNHRPAHAGLAGHGLEDGDRYLRGV